MPRATMPLLLRTHIRSEVNKSTSRSAVLVLMRTAEATTVAEVVCEGAVEVLRGGPTTKVVEVSRKTEAGEVTAREEGAATLHLEVVDSPSQREDSSCPSTLLCPSQASSLCLRQTSANLQCHST